MMTCASCRDHMHPWHRDKPCPRCHRGRGLCRPCYDRARRQGTLHDHERHTMAADHVLDDYELLHLEGHTRQQIAERLGMTRNGLDKVLERARRRGDPRADDAYYLHRRGAA